jgi:hypothetical protein
MAREHRPGVAVFVLAGAVAPKFATPAFFCRFAKAPLTPFVRAVGQADIHCDVW